MFIVTARLPRRKLLRGAITVFCCCLVIAAALLFVSRQDAVTTLAEASGIRNDDDRIAYLTELGWQTTGKAVTVEELLIPDSFDQSYTDYLALQAGQGFDLTKYTGKRVKRYTYDITNYPDAPNGVQAALLVYRSKIIGGQLQAKDGSFILPLSGQT